jgi:ribonuclease HI
MVEIYTDGACAGNPGPGGWGAVIIDGGDRIEISGGDSATTNNRMEMTAAIKALNATSGAQNTVLYTDSQYVKLGVTEWLKNWKRKGWRTADGKPVKNRDLWEQLDALNSAREIDWRWLRGHTGHPENERADELARQAIAEVSVASK